MPALEFSGESTYLWDGTGFRPILPIRLMNPVTGFSVESYGLIDSGADSTVVRHETLRRLGFDLGVLGQRATVGTAGDAFSYEAPVVLEVCATRFPALVLSSRLEGINFELLGRTPLFQPVHFAFEEYAEPWRNRTLWKLP